VIDLPEVVKILKKDLGFGIWDLRGGWCGNVLDAFHVGRRG
jgi:hypothetical protein